MNEDNLEPSFPTGQVEVARYWINETLLAANFWTVLSRDPHDGGYCLTSGLGNYFLAHDKQTKRGALWRVVHNVTKEEAILWLERELCYSVAAGDSPYNKWRSLSLNREEIRRLVSDFSLNGYLFIKRLLCRLGPDGIIRRDQIEHSKIHFTDMTPDNVCRDIGPDLSNSWPNN